MNDTSKQRACLSLSLAALSWLLLPDSAVCQQWTAPTPEELAMTSIAEVPGAAAVFLDKNEITDDSLHMHSFYYRLKVLTERGKEYANVELPFYHTEFSSSQIDQVEGRTIHSDGTIVPFTGKPYEKFIVKTGGLRVKAKVFTLPAVETGSIIEYRYKFRLDDNGFQEPQWYIQSELYTRKAHYMWRPTEKMLVNEKGDVVSGAIAWTPFLPQGAEVKQTELITGGHQLELNVHDIPPLPQEEDMPPINSVSYRVQFYYTPYRTREEFWKNKGKEWSKGVDKFAQPNGQVSDFAKSLVSASDTDDQKARKLYAAVMAIENTDYTREHTTREDKAEGFRGAKSAGDILDRKRGDSDELTGLFVALARGAGLKAYVMGVADRNKRLFVPAYMSLGQLDADVAIVQLGGKDVFFDPGERYCEAEHLSWRHADTAGIRQTDSGTELAKVPGESYKTAHTTRLADLKVDEHGQAEGTVTLQQQGDPALHWRHAALTADRTALDDDLKKWMETLLPDGMEVKVASVENLEEFDKPLKVKFEVKGPVGSATGKRLMLPVDVFEVHEKARFPELKREIPVDMHYASNLQDAVRFKLPDGMAVESAPEPQTEKMLTLAQFDVKSVKGTASVTSYRSVSVADPIFLPSQYGDLRSFYSKLEAKDQETIVLTHAAAAPPAAVGAVAKPGGE